MAVRNSQYKCMNIGFNLLAQFMIKKKVQIKEMHIERSLIVALEEMKIVFIIIVVFTVQEILM